MSRIFDNLYWYYFSSVVIKRHRQVLVHDEKNENNPGINGKVGDAKVLTIDGN